MKKMHEVVKLLLVFSFVFSLASFAEAITDPLPESAFWSELLVFLSGWQGKSALAITAGVVQAIMIFFRTPLANFAGKVKLTVVTGLSVVGVVLGGLMSGQSILVSLLSGAGLAALQVFVNQVIQQFSEKPVQVIGK